MFQWLQRRSQPQDEGVILGTGRRYSEPRGREHQIVLPDRLPNKHAIIWGKSGMGKSRFLFPIIMQKICAGESVVVFDSHEMWPHILDAIGQEFELEDLVGRICIINPTDLRYGVVGLNVLETNEGLEPFAVTEELLSAFKSIWSESFGDRMADLIRQTCWTLVAHKLTLKDFTRLLSDEEFRRRLVSTIDHEETRLFWQYFDRLKGEARTWVESSRNKVSALMMNPFAKLMLSQPKSTVRFGDVINHPKGGICFVHLSRDDLKTDQQRLLGALIFSKLYMSILARKSIPESERRPVNIFVEEASEIFQPDAVLNILSGARKLGARLWLCFQSIAQVSAHDVQLILNGAAVHVVFNVEREEAKRLLGLFSFTGTHVKHEERDFWGPKGKPSFYSIQDEQENCIRELIIQRNRECYIRIFGDDCDEPYITEAPFVEYPPEQETIRNELHALSARCYAIPYGAAVSEVEKSSFGGEGVGGYNKKEDAPQQPEDLMSLFQGDEFKKPTRSFKGPPKGHKPTARRE